MLFSRWLALPAAFLPLLVAAVPSTAHAGQHPFTAPARPDRSRWRTLSGQLIDSIWGPPKTETGTLATVSKTSAWAPPHTLARYGRDVVLRFNVSTPEEAQSLAEAADTLILDVWEFSHDWVDIRLSTDIVAPLLGLLPASLQQSHTPLLRERDLAQAIFDTHPSPRGPKAEPVHTPSASRDREFSPALQRTNDEHNIFFDDYQPLSVIDPWMRLMASLFTTHVRKVNIGVSAQGRDIAGLRVGVHPTNADKPNPSKRKTILVTGGFHAREWISTSTVNYVAYTLITGYGKVPSITRLLETFDFVFVPTMNPDGYVYTWETDRLWRKNRQQTTFRFCQGIDLDRAFGFQWDGATTTAGNPCSESFAGEQAFEAVEAKRLAEWVKNETTSNNVDLVGLLDLHSYSQQILYPYSYSCDATPPGLENLEELAIGLQRAMRIKHGHVYEVIAACEGNSAFAEGSVKGSKPRLWPRMEASGGSALDWFYHELRVRFAYQIKLPDRGMYGFLLPKEHIVPTGKEVLDAVLYFGRFLSETYSVETDAAADEKDEGEVWEAVGGEADPSDEQDEEESERWLVGDVVEPNRDLRRRRRR
ncbi:hypothetical protein LTR08_006593 [Meristemomyces frigidus]|nr:hypothetical protein LTR08_006593 [Meristemomyces frigidus]